jgi:hypothetical protein
MKKFLIVPAVIAFAVSGAAFAQTSATPSNRDTPNRDTNAPANTPASSAPKQTKDPSSTRGRPDASYPNPSAQDTRTDAAARAHTEKGHDHAADTNSVDATPSAGPTGKQSAYTGASGKKANPETGCITPTDSPTQGRPAKPGTRADAAECAGEKSSDSKTDGESRRATAPPPGATAPVHK